ncbi:MAG: PGF-pre-PGF domain-containing protein [Candidatus Aenigmarchaeota archaeon]|nr:PGF-pre-PGF domain-containing protein [Candidatus Aenigmarchaeota archaeon]
MKLSFSVLLALSFIFIASVSNAAFTVTINSPANFSNTSDSTPQIAFTITGDNTTYNYSVIVDGAIDHAAVTQRIDNNTQHHVNLSALINGTHWVVIEGRNSSAAGDAIVSVNSTNITFKVDNVNPGVTITSPGNSTNTTDSTPEIRFNVSDNVHATNLTYRIYVDGTVVTANDTNNNTNIAYNFTALTNGTHNFRVEINDPSGNGYNTTLFNITIDNINPAVTITSPANSTNSTDSTPEIRFNVSDNVFATNLSYRVYVDDSVQTANDTNNNTIIAYNLTALTNGTHRFRVEITDPAGNVFNSTLLTITVDNVNPTPRTVSPPNETSTSDDTPQIYFNITDNVHATNLTYRIYLGSTFKAAGETTNNTNVAYNFSSLDIGAYLIRIEGTDPSGNAANSTALYLYIVNETTSTTTSTSSSGGSSPISQKAVQSWNVLGPGKSEIEIDKSNLDVKSIELDVKNTVSNAKITVEKLSGVSDILSSSISGKAYQYIEITKEKIKDEDINGARITFEVPKSWLADNNYSKENVVLMRYTTAWERLPTSVVSESASQIQFAADTPGFSTFAIAAAEIIPAATTTTSTTMPPADTTTTTTIEEAKIPAPPADYTAIAIAGLLLAALASYAYRHNFQGKAPKKKE